MPASTSSAHKTYPRPLHLDVQLPDADVRIRFNERAFRNWTESSRRIARVTVLAASDIAAGLLGVFVIHLAWLGATELALPWASLIAAVWLALVLRWG